MKSIGRTGFRALTLERREGDTEDVRARREGDKEDVRVLRLGEVLGEEVGVMARVAVRFRSRGAK